VYGMANRIIQDMIVAWHGLEAWDGIREKAGIQEPFFIQMGCYPDELTYQIVGAASEVLGIPPREVLHQFGEYWITVAERDYAEMVLFAGKDLVAILDSVDEIHARASLIFPEMRPPSFRCSDVSDESFRLHYNSVREGLAPFVEGLVTGLGKRLSAPVDVAHDKSRTEGADHDEFVVGARKT